MQNNNLNVTNYNESSGSENSKKKSKSKKKKKKRNKKSSRNDMNDSINSYQSHDKFRKNKRDNDNESIEIMKKKINDLSISVNSNVNEEKTNKKKHFCSHYCLYLAKREIIISSIYHKKENVPVSVRVSLFFLVMSFAFTINCFFLTSSIIHNRYNYALSKKINEIKYSFFEEYLRSIYCTIIINVFKIVCVKIVYNTVFKVSAENKEKMSPYIDRNNCSEKEKLKLYFDRKEYLNRYRRNLIIYIFVALILNVVFALISVCYVGIFINTFYGLLVGFVLSFIFSFVVCVVLCWIIVAVYHLGSCCCCGCKCFDALYKLMKTIY